MRRVLHLFSAATADTTRGDELDASSAHPPTPSDLPWIVLVGTVALFFILDPVGFVYEPAAAVAASQIRVNAGERVVLRAKGSADFTYAWREVTQSGAVLVDADTAAASFVAPPGPATTALEFEVTVSNGWRERVLPVRVTVHRSR